MLGGTRLADAVGGSSVFQHGVASGDPVADGVIIWTRVTGSGRVPVRWRVALDPAQRRVVKAGSFTTGPERDHTVKVDVRGLRPGTRYYYAFEALGGRSPVGRTITAPTGATGHLRLAVVSCSNWQAGWFNGYARIADRDDVDVVVHLGDYLYEYGNGDDRYGAGRDHDPPHEMVTLADYRRRHAQYKTDPDLQRLHGRVPFVVLWDDHESANDAWRGGAENHDPATEGDWQARKAAAVQAYSEWMPIRAGDPSVISRNLPFGDLAELVVLDTRLERDQQIGATGLTLLNGLGIDDPDRRMLGDRQRAFLDDRLSRSTARWKVLAQQVMLAQWNLVGLPRGVLDVLPLRNGGNALNPDQWDGYVAERDRFFATVRRHDVDGLLVLTGDLHTSFANDLVEDPYDVTRYNPVSGRGALGVELVTPSITSANFADLGPGIVRTLEAGTKALNPHMRWVNYDRHGYVLLDLTHERARADWWFVDDVATRGGGESRASSWQVRAGERFLRAVR